MRPARGFTLIELLVVIAIIGVLASIVIASTAQSRIKGRDARRIADLSSIRTALELYSDSNNRYPDCLYAGTNNTGSSCLTSLEGSSEMPVVPTDPLTNARYSYARISPAVGAAHCASGNNFHLGASLENRSNPALAADADLVRSDVANGGRCYSATNYDFYGLSAAAGGQACSVTTDGTTGTETCYDLVSL